MVFTDEEDEVCGEEILLLDSANITDNDLLPLHFHKSALSQNMSLILMIELLVGFVALEVLIA